MLDKEGREEGKVKRRTNLCRKVLSHLPQLSVSTASLTCLLFVLTQTLPRQEGETEKGALVPS